MHPCGLKGRENLPPPSRAPTGRAAVMTGVPRASLALSPGLGSAGPLGRTCRLSVYFNGAICAWILASTAPRPNRLAIASAAMSVASPSREASRASISFLSGVP